MQYADPTDPFADLTATDRVALAAGADLADAVAQEINWDDNDCPHNVRCTTAEKCAQGTRPCGHRTDQAYPCCLAGGTVRVTE